VAWKLPSQANVLHDRCFAEATEVGTPSIPAETPHNKSLIIRKVRKRLLQQILSGASDANIRFEDLRSLLARRSHGVSSRDARDGRGYEACAAQRAEAYLNSLSSTVSKRNEVDAALSRVAAESL